MTRIAWVTTVIFLSGALAWGQGVPEKISFQGKLTNASNHPVNGTVSMTFRLYDGASGGAPLWTETLSVSVVRGIYTVYLGETLPLTASLLTGPRWIGLEVASDGEMTPRYTLTSSPYALRAAAAESADSLGGITATTYARLDTAQAFSAAQTFNAALSGTLASFSGSPAGPTVYGLNSATSGTGSGVAGRTDSTDGRGVWGYASATAAGNAYGVLGESLSTTGVGVHGIAQSATGTTKGVYGRSLSTTGYGVHGQGATGVWGQGGGTGVIGEGTSTGVYGYGRWGLFAESDSTTGAGVFSHSWALTGFTYGVFAISDSSSGVGVWGESYGTHGVYGRAFTDSGVGVEGEALSTSGTGVRGTGPTYGVYGSTSSGTGVYGRATSNAGGTIGVRGETQSPSGYAVYGVAFNNGRAVVGSASSPGHAGYFFGDVHVAGNLTKSSGAFKIDHPLDPGGKYLAHSFVESPDMKNLYDGVARLDEKGEAWIALPEWFEALNREFRYQLTAIGKPAPDLYIASEIAQNRFQIAGGAPGMKVSWQVTGSRQDPYAKVHPMQVEEEKRPEDRGRYLNPEAYGRPRSDGIGALPETPAK